MKSLDSLLQKIKDIESGQIAVSCNSKDIKYGDIFVVIDGFQRSGADFIPEAIENGAKHIVLPNDKCRDAQEKIYHSSDKCEFYIAENDARKTFAYLSSILYPGQPKNICCITGTNGKTSSTYFYGQIMAYANGVCGVISGEGMKIFSFKDGKMCASNIRDEVRAARKNGYSGRFSDYEYNLTTAPASVLHQALHYLQYAGIQHAVIEASSHGIDQHRLYRVNFNCAAITNIGRDHIDYHKTYEEYFSVKSSLFLHHSVQIAAINSDIEEYKNLREICINAKKRVVPYGFSHDSGEGIQIISKERGGVVFRWRNSNEIHTLIPSIDYSFQLDNIACVASTLLAQGVSVDIIKSAVQHIKAPEGRMECVVPGVYVDHAHTPDAMLRAIEAVKGKIANGGRILLLFGCGGDRDKGKRIDMGEVADKNADIIIITDDNPRFESPEQIRSNIMRGIKSNKSVLEIGDRREAIRTICSMKRGADIVLICGRGCEGYLNYKGERIELDDRKCVLGV